MGAEAQLASIASLVLASTEEEMRERMRVAAFSAGFDQVLFGIELRRHALPPIQHITSAYRQDYQVVYRDKGFIMRDPTVWHCQTQTTPLVWDEGMYTTPESRELMEESRSYGLGYGLSVPVHESANVVSMLSLARDRPFDGEADKQRTIELGAVLANCLHVASKRVLIPRIEESMRPRLTPRELECLKWLAEGKSNAVIGQILHISEAAVVFHVNNLFRKMNVSTRLQAAVAALSMGMLK